MFQVFHRYSGKSKVEDPFCTDFYADIGILPLFQMDSSKNQGLTVLFSLIFWFARHGRALMGESPEHARIVGSVQPNSKGVRREVESEGSCKQISGPTDRNHI